MRGFITALACIGLLALAGCGEEPVSTASGCTVQDNGDGTKTISCEDGTEVTVSDGIPGTSGTQGDPGEKGDSCTVADNGDGTKTIACDDGTTVTVSDGADAQPCTLIDNGDGTATLSCPGADPVTIATDGASSCTVKDNGDGTYTLTCSDGSTATIQNGIDGEDGTTCSIVDNGDGTKTITCDDGTTVTVSDGADAQPCTLIDNGDGTATLSCPGSVPVTIATDGASSCTVKDNGNGTYTLTCSDGSTATIQDGIDGEDGTTCTIVDNGDGTVTIGCGGGTEVTVNKGARTVLNGTTTFWVATDGNDSTGDGSYANPWRTRQRAYNVLSSNYDVNCQTVYIRSKAGIYTDSFQVYAGRLFGQCAPSSIIFSNETDEPCGDVVIQPAAQAGYAFSAAFGASYKIQCMKVDMTSQRDAAVDNIITAGADTISSGQGSHIFFGHGLTFGCNFNGYNHVSVSFGGYTQFDNDFDIDVGLCQVVTTGATTSGSNQITSLASTNNVIVGQGIIAAGLPLDARIGALSGNTITIVCATTPAASCVANTTASDVTLTFTGGGQSFLNPGNGSTVYFNTNGQPDYSVIVTLGNYPHFIAGFMFVNGGSTVNAEALTFVNPQQARGRCSEVRALSHIGTGRQGVPYLPCFGAGYDGFTTTANTTAGSKTISVASTTNMAIGQVINGIANPTGTWDKGSDTLTLSSTPGVCVGAHITGPGILGGAVINGIVGSTVTLNPCGGGPKCVKKSPSEKKKFPTYLAGSDTGLTITGCGVPNNAIIKDIVGTEVTLSIPAETTVTAHSVVFQSYTSGNAIYD